jgi:hypothetical protein
MKGGEKSYIFQRYVTSRNSGYVYFAFSVFALGIVCVCVTVTATASSDGNVASPPWCFEQRTPGQFAYGHSKARRAFVIEV